MYLSHRAHVTALVRRAEELKRRASEAAAENIRRIEATRDLNQDNLDMLNALTAVTKADMGYFASIQDLHRVIVETAGSELQKTRSQRRRVRRDLAEGVAVMERAVAHLEEGIDP